MNQTAKNIFFSLCAIIGLAIATVGFILSNTGNSIFIAPCLFIIGLLMLTIGTVSLTLLRDRQIYEKALITDLNVAYGSVL
jgi:hypothetical protein